MKRKAPPARVARKTAITAAVETAVAAPNAAAIAAARSALIALERADGRAEQATIALSEHLAKIWSEPVTTAVVMSLLRPGLKQRDSKSLWSRVDRARVMAFGIARKPRKPRASTPARAITKAQKVEVVEAWIRAVPARTLAELVRKLRPETYAAALAASLGEVAQ